MKTLKLSLAALGALGLLTTQASAGGLMDAVGKSTVSGYAYLRWNEAWGAGIKQANGFRFQTAAAINTDLGKGWAFNTGARVNVGSGAPGSSDNNTVVTTWLNGNNGGNGFVLTNFNFTKTFANTKTFALVGAEYIIAPWDDPGADHGAGLRLWSEGDIKGFNIGAAVYSAVGLDEGYAFSNVLSFVGMSTNPDEAHGVDFKFYGGYVSSALGLIFGELAYQGGDENLHGRIGLQVSYAKMNGNPTLNIKGMKSEAGVVLDLSEVHAASDSTAKMAKERLIYDIQMKVGGHGAEFTLGYTGSGADGYGSMLNYMAQFNQGGQTWNDIGSDDNGVGQSGMKDANGFAIFGPGSISGSNISVVYANLNYTFASSGVNIGIDGVYVTGKNYYNAPSKATTDKLGAHVDLFEVTPMVKVQILPNLGWKLQYSYIGKDIDNSRLRTQFTYNF